MKSADVSGAIPPQVRSAQAEAAGAAGQVTAGGRAATVARAAAAAAAALQRVAPKGIDRLAQEAARSLSILRPQAARVWVIELPARHALSVSGYAPAPRAASSPGPTGAPAAAKTSGPPASSKGQWAFLDDRTLSIEDKLFMFMKLVMKKSNDELEKKMKEYQAIKSGGTSGSSGASGAGKSSGGLFGVLKKAFPPLAALEKAIPALPQLVNKLASDLGPQLLGALMIPLGAPWAAPLVQRAASELLPGAIAALDGAASAATGSTSSGGSSGASNGGDERMQLLEIERMMQKTNQMFATISNILKATHDAAMTAVNNIR